MWVVALCIRPENWGRATFGKGLEGQQFHMEFLTGDMPGRVACSDKLKISIYPDAVILLPDTNPRKTCVHLHREMHIRTLSAATRTAPNSEQLKCLLLWSQCLQNPSPPLY